MSDAGLVSSVVTLIATSLSTDAPASSSGARRQQQKPVVKFIFVLASILWQVLLAPIDIEYPEKSDGGAASGKRTRAEAAIECE